MASGDVKLIGLWASPYAIRAMIALNLKGVDYELLEEPLVGVNKSDILVKSNPVYKKIPVLLHGDKSIPESMIIINYIDDAWPSTGPALLPSDPFDRATARFWAVYIDDKLFPALKAAAMSTTEEAAAEAVKELMTALQLLEEAFEKNGKGNRFFGGDTIGYVDIALTGFLGWLRAVEKMAGIKILDEGKTPLLVGWAEHLVAHEAVKGVMPEADKLIEFAKKLVAAAAAAAQP